MTTALHLPPPIVAVSTVAVACIAAMTVQDVGLIAAAAVLVIGAVGSAVVSVVVAVKASGAVGAAKEIVVQTKADTADIKKMGEKTHDLVNGTNHALRAELAQVRAEMATMRNALEDKTVGKALAEAKVEAIESKGPETPVVVEISKMPSGH